VALTCVLTLSSACGGDSQEDIVGNANGSTTGNSFTDESFTDGESSIDDSFTEEESFTGEEGFTEDDVTEEEGFAGANDNTGIGDNTVQGVAYDQDGYPLEGVEIYIYIVPRSYGALYRTVTGPDGSYSYQVPEGVYLVLAEIYPDDDEPEIGESLEPIGEDGSITVPPSQVIDFRLP
jgi:hypothetical protein